MIDSKPIFYLDNIQSVYLTQVILCDLCDRGFHLFCIGLDCVPHGEFMHCTYVV